MKTPKDFMPPRLEFGKFNVGIIELDKSSIANAQTCQAMFDKYYDTHIKPLFENGVVMYSPQDPRDKKINPGIGINKTSIDRFCFLAICIQPLDQAVTIDELREALGGRKDLLERWEKWGVQ